MASSNKKKLLLAASIAGLMAVSATTATTNALADEAAPCYGVNACKGTGDCGGKGHGCAGKNACEGKGYIELSKEDCLRIKGGSLTEAEG